MTDYAEIISRSFALSKNDQSDYGKMKVGPMAMEAVSYKAIGLGHVSVMRGKAMLGLMKMDTVVINPFEKDVPLFSLDRISVAGKEKLLIELYETRLNPVSLENDFGEIVSKYAAIPDGASEPRWYDEIRLPESMYKIGSRHDKDTFDKITAEYIERYLKLAAESADCDASAKTAEAKKYTDGLLTNGGAATDIFVKQKGKAFTERFLRECMFGV